MTHYNFVMTLALTGLAAWTPGINGLEVAALAAIGGLIRNAQREEETAS